MLILPIVLFLCSFTGVIHCTNVRPTTSTPNVHSNNASHDLLDIQSLIQFKLPDDNVAAVNKQINLEYSAMYTYEVMAAFFDSITNPMPGCSKFFRKQADTQLRHARVFISFLNVKAGKLFLPDIKAPTVSTWDSCMSAMQDALRIEIQIRHSLHDLSKRAGKELDFAFEKLADEMILINAKLIKNIADIARQFQRSSSCSDGNGKASRGGIGEFVIDKELQRDSDGFSSQLNFP